MTTLGLCSKAQSRIVFVAYLHTVVSLCKTSFTTFASGITVLTSCHFLPPPCLSVPSPPPGVIVLAFILCWLPFHVGRTIFYFKLDSDWQEAYMDLNSDLDMNTLSDVSIHQDTHTVTTPTCQSDSDTRFKTPSVTGEITAPVHTERDEIFCEICAKVKISIHTNSDTHLADTESDDTSRDRRLIFSHTRRQLINNGKGTHNRDPSTETDTHSTKHAEAHNDVAHVDTHTGRFTDKQHTNAHNSTNTATHKDTNRIPHIIKQISQSNSNSNTHTNKPCCADKHTLTSTENRTSTCIHTQKTPKHTPPAADINTHAVTPADLYNDNTHNDTLFNDTYIPDTSHFLYYLSQYFNLVSFVLFYLSAAVNPLLYNLMSARYRHAVHSLIHTRSHTQSHRLRTLTTRHSTTTL